MRHIKKSLIYATGVLSGLGVAFATLSGASDSVVPYEFKDGQVISADTLNDLFGRIKASTEGFTATDALVGSWSCVTYESRSNPNPQYQDQNFTLDNTTGLQKLTQTWVFSNNGRTLTVDKAKLGGIGNNYTGTCPSQTSFVYDSRLVEGFLFLTGSTSDGCAASQGHTATISKQSPYRFRLNLQSAITGAGPVVVSCVAVNQPPAIPTELSASLGSNGVTLSWTNGGGSPSGFSVLKKVSGVYTEIATVSGNATTYTDASGESGNLYRVKSTNSNGSSLPSSAAIAK